jgi:hypothetical protein
MEIKMDTKYLKLIIISSILAISSLANAGIIYDADVTNEVIFGSGNANGSFTVVQDNGIELGLRGKLRHNAAGAPENTFNSNGDGTYSFNAGVAPTQATPTAVWSFEWSINSDYLGISGFKLADYLFEIRIDSDPTAGVDFVTTFDLFSTALGTPDHAIGDNTTLNGAGVSALDNADFSTLTAGNNLAQNSWKPHWFIGGLGFDPTLDATYDISILALSRTQSSVPLAVNTIQVIVGNGATAVPEPSTLVIFALGMMGLASCRFKKS